MWAEPLATDVRGNNTHVKSQATKPTGEFQTEMAEATVKAEYDFINLYKA